MSNLDKLPVSRQEAMVSLAEGLTHYLLTLAMIPSQRKTSFQSVEIDVAVPDTRTLSSNPSEVVIIYFPKTDDVQTIKENVELLRKIQPSQENLWLVVYKPIQLDAKMYTLNKEDFSFSKIINDLIAFSSNKKQSRLKIFRI